MILLDTDHLSALKYEESEAFARLSARMFASADQDFAATVISFEEQMRGWLAVIARWNDPLRQVPAYEELAKLNEFYSRWKLVRFDERAAHECARLRRLLPRVGTMDLKIASIALSRDTLLLTANTRDFGLASGLRIENWLAPQAHS